MKESTSKAISAAAVKRDHERKLRDSNETSPASSAHDHKQSEQSQQTEAALRNSEERYRTLFELGPMAVYSCDVSGVIREFNRRAAELWGRAPALGDTDQRFCGSFKMIRPDGSVMAHEQSPMAEVLSGAIPQARDAEVSFERPDGSRVTVVVNISPLKNEQGMITGAINCFYDVTERKQAEQQLRRSAELLNFLIDRSPSGFYIVNSDFRISHINADSQARAFRNVVPAIGRGLDEAMRILWPEPLATEVINIFRHTLDTGEPYRSPGLVSPRNDLDTVETYEWQLDRITMPDGSYSVVCYYYDTTRYVAAELATARLAAIVSSSDDAIVSKDLNGVIASWNRGAERVFGYTAEEVVGKPVTILIPDDHLDEEPEILARIRRGEPVEHYETVRRRKDGTLIDVSLTVSPLRDDAGRVIGASKVARDITARVRLAKQTREQAAELSDLHRRKDEFMAMLGHELRNPLAPIANAVQLLRLEKNPGPIQEQARTIIERQVGQLTRLIEDLMEVSRMSTGRIHLNEERLDLRGVVGRAVDTVRPLIAQRRHAISVSSAEAPIWVIGDAGRLEQVVVNLLNNAAKYTDEAGHIWLGLEQAGDEAVLRIRDTGIGIAPDLLPRIFDLFIQGDRSLDRSAGGLGIGLALVRQIVLLHRGRVEATSVVGQGSEFTVRLPVVASPISTPQPPATGPEELQNGRCRVLVVDDNVDSLYSLKTLLKAAGHEVATALDGAAALEAARTFLPDVVLLDIGIPKLNGYEVAAHIRSEQALNKTLLVAATGYGQEVDRQRSREAGIDHHLVKPLDFKKVKEILATVAEQRQPA